MTFKFTFSFCREILILGSHVSEWMEADWDQALFVALTSCISQPAQRGLETGPVRSLGNRWGLRGTVPAGSEVVPAPGQEVRSETPDEARDSPQDSNGGESRVQWRTYVSVTVANWRTETYRQKGDLGERRKCQLVHCWVLLFKSLLFKSLLVLAASATCCLKLCARGHFSSQVSVSPSVQLEIRLMTPKSDEPFAYSQFPNSSKTFFFLFRACWNSELNVRPNFLASRGCKLLAAGPNLSHKWALFGLLNVFKLWLKCQHPWIRRCFIELWTSAFSWKVGSVPLPLTTKPWFSGLSATCVS